MCFSVVRTSRTSSAALITRFHETSGPGRSGPGSRSHTSRFGRSISSAVEFQVWISTIPICARETTASMESATRYSPTLVFSWIRTRRSALGPHAFACFRKLARRHDARRAMNQCQRSASHVGNNPLGDALVVSSELNLRNPQVGVDYSVGVRDSNSDDGRGRIAACRRAPAGVLGSGDRCANSSSVATRFGCHGRAGREQQ